jgi:aerobic-type carbon monoxide dehydrogenase small subunit (CoxS/CutS family)
LSEPTIALRVNGQEVAVPLAPQRSLLEALRLDLGLTGSKYGCGEGECGACTVLVGRVPVRACQLPVTEAAGREIRTIEGLASATGELTPVQRAFVELGAFQCGFCTAGMIVAATALLARDPSPSRPEVETALDGNLCRCGGYLRILRAVQRAAEIGPTEVP